MNRIGWPEVARSLERGRPRPQPGAIRFPAGREPYVVPALAGLGHVCPPG